MTEEVTLLGTADTARPRALCTLFARWGLRLRFVDPGLSIPGSYWGVPEAGLVGDTLYVRADTPLNSVLHEACHFRCMDEQRRVHLDTDAGGDDVEECAVCYLSILIARDLADYSLPSMLRDMDRWGYSFRVGSAQAWFEDDAEDAANWLRHRGLIDTQIR